MNQNEQTHIRATHTQVNTHTHEMDDSIRSKNLLQLLFWPQVARVAAAAFTTVGRTGRQTGVAFSTDHLVTVVLLGQQAQRRLDHTTTQTEDQVQGRLLLDVVVGQSAAIFQLFAGKDQTLLVRRNSFLVLNLGFHIFDGVVGLHLQGDGLAGQGLDEDLHG